MGSMFSISKSSVRRSSLIASLLAAAFFLLPGCYSKPETGSVGILKHWGGEISTKAYTGFTWTVFDDMVAHVDTTETRAPIEKMQPSDVKGVLVERVDLIVSFRLEPNLVPAFYIQTKELDVYRDDAGREVTTVGLKVLENIVRHAVQEVTKKEPMIKLASDLGGYEKSILAQAQLELDAGYPGVFHLIRINVNHFEPPASVREQANKTLALAAEAERNTVEQGLITQRAQLETAKAELEARALKAAMAATSLSAKELTDWHNAQAYMRQADAMGTKAVPTLSAATQPAPAEKSK